MPGTIQVTVLEFKGVSSNSSKPSAKSLKVSMGKREFQTWDKGEFNFPIAKLSDDLVVALLDAAGNEVARLDIKTMHIIEKGSWDEVFPINGCGHVHMKLQFVLSEEERYRIRIMRESVVKTKLEMNPSIVQTGNSVETGKETKQVSDSEKDKDEVFQSDLYPDSGTANRKEEGTDLEAAIPDTTDGGRVAPLSPDNKGVGSESALVCEMLPDNKIESHLVADIRSITEEVVKSKLPGSEICDSVASKSEDDPMQKSRRIKAPSNVRKMISAFESSQETQDTGRMDSNREAKSLMKTPSVQSQFNRPRKESLQEYQEPTAGVSPDEYTRQSADIVSSGTEPTQISAATHFLLKGNDSTKPKVKELQKSQSMAESASVTATSSGRMVEEQFRVDQVYEEASNSGMKLLGCYEEECASAQSSGLWIFPDDTRRLCITTASEHVMKIAEYQTCHGRNISSESKVLETNVMLGMEHKMEKNRKETADLSQSGLGCSPGDSSNGVFGKVIKLAAISGFGLLVLLTRQKEPRKSSYTKKKIAEEFDNLFLIPNYIDERTQKP